METGRLKLFISVLLMMLVVILPAAAFGQKTIDIGVNASLTGFAAASEVHFRDGVVMGVEWMNEKGGITIKGEKYLLRAVVEDNKTTAEGAKAAAEKLVYDHKVKFILGAAIPYINIAAGAVTEPAKVIRGVNYSCETPAEINVNTPYTFKVNPGSIDGITPSLDYLLEKYPQIKTFSITTPADGAEKYLIPLTEKEGLSRGLKLTGSVPWPHDTVDFYPVITKALASHPDALCMVNGYEQATGPMVKAAREKGFKGPVLMTCYDCPYDIAEIAGKNLVAPFWTHGWSQDSDDPKLTEEMRLIIKTAKAKLGKFHQWNLWGWNGVWVVSQAIEKAQSLDTTEVANSWRKMETLKTVYGPGKMGGLKTYGIKNSVCAPVAITEVLPDGTVKHIKWINVYIP
ncbi:MAG: ABC transporter substrate-binding protein [Thermodesulfobacteriota bacterium]|jgi:branched-chain amino acid transport system substrate-binding protein